MTSYRVDRDTLNVSIVSQAKFSRIHCLPIHPLVRWKVSLHNVTVRRAEPSN